MAPGAKGVRAFDICRAKVAALAQKLGIPSIQQLVYDGSLNIISRLRRYDVLLSNGCGVKVGIKITSQEASGTAYEKACFRYCDMAYWPADITPILLLDGDNWPKAHAGADGVKRFNTTKDSSRFQFSKYALTFEELEGFLKVRFGL